MCNNSKQCCECKSKSATKTHQILYEGQPRYTMQEAFYFVQVKRLEHFVLTCKGNLWIYKIFENFFAVLFRYNKTNVCFTSRKMMWKNCLFLALTVCLLFNFQVVDSLASRKKDDINPLWLIMLFSGMMNNQRSHSQRKPLIIFLAGLRSSFG